MISFDEPSQIPPVTYVNKLEQIHKVIKEFVLQFYESV